MRLKFVHLPLTKGFYEMNSRFTMNRRNEHQVADKKVCSVFLVARQTSEFVLKQQFT